MITIGILAHVDAGKTTLSEQILYECGVIRKIGRVDNGEASMDSDTLERQRGITIFSSSAHFSVGNKSFNLLDTPGHTDFSAEMERTLSVLDYAILVISGAEGVQGHTYTLWKLLKNYNIPTFVFVNKMDRAERSKAEILKELSDELGGIFADFVDVDNDQIVMADEYMLNRYLEEGIVDDKDVIKAVKKRRLFPVYFGSALKGEGIRELLDGISRYMMDHRPETDKFSASVFKITHSPDYGRMTHLKVMSGTLRIRDRVGEDKITRIRLYDGAEYTEVNEVGPGTVCSVLGLRETYPGQGIGRPDMPKGVLEPVMTYQVNYPADVARMVMMGYLRELEEEDPALSVTNDEKSGDINVRVMGVIQLEILKSIIKDRYKVDVEFSRGTIVYKETITSTVEGVGHFEPLHHYAEVHFLIEPGEKGSGIVARADLQTEDFSGNYRRLVLQHLTNEPHYGVLTGSELTDVVVTLKAGKYYDEYTHGGDMREATRRGMRQGLLQAESVLLEPYYDFQMRVPQTELGRAMLDVDNMYGTYSAPMVTGEFATLSGSAPVSEMWDYQKDFVAYTKGRGSLTLSMHGYEICHNSEAVIKEKNYDPEADTDNPSFSIFVWHGVGHVIYWNQVPQYMHLESILGTKRDDKGVPITAVRTKKVDEWLDSDEVDAILNRAVNANKRAKSRNTSKKVINPSEKKIAKPKSPKEIKPEYMLVDGYNIIFAWDELKKLAATSVDSARLKLQDIVSNYAGFTGREVAVIFDAYRLENHKTEQYDYHNIHVVFTATAQTADHYIEEFTKKHANEYDITVATSDGIEQIIIQTHGSKLLSATNLYEEVRFANEQIAEMINGSF